jgi:phosphatidylglycerol---prolipoprotein diacylglyceryl transferase
MYPNLYYVFFDIFGIDVPFLKLINSFGFFVALAFIIGSWVLGKELKRKEEEGLMQAEKKTIEPGKPATPLQIAGNAFFGFLFGYKFVYLAINSGKLFDGTTLPQEHIFSSDGSWLWGILFAVIFGAYTWWEGQKAAKANPEKKEVVFHKYEYVGAITLVAAITGIIGAKLFHLFENPKEFFTFFANPSLDSFLAGLTIYGGLLVGGTLTYLYAKRKGIPGLHLLDSASPGLILAYGVGRIGCQISGDGDWGIPNLNPKPGWLNWLPDWMWAYHYPNNVNQVYGPRAAGYTGKLIKETDPWPIFPEYGTYLDPAVYPTPFYETMMAFAIFGILWALRKRIKTPGIVFAIYLMFNGFERFWIEKIRVNSTYEIFGSQITQAEIISTLMFLTGLALIFIFRNRSKTLPHA